MQKVENKRGFAHLFHLVARVFRLIGGKCTLISVASIILFSAQNFFANYLIARCMANLLDVLLYGGKILEPLIYFFISFALFCVSLAMGFWGLQYVSTYGAKKIRLAMFKKALTVCFEDIDLRDTSQIQARLGDDVNGAIHLASFGPANWLMPYVAGTSSLIVILTIQPLLLIPIVTFSLAELFINLAAAPKIREQSKNLVEEKAAIGQQFASNCLGAESIRNFSVKEPAIKLFSTACKNFISTNLKFTKISCNLDILSSVSGWVCMTGTLLFGLLLTTWFDISLPNLILASKIACLVKTMISGIGSNWSGIQSTMVQAERLFDVLDTVDEDENLPDLPKEIPDSKTCLEVRNLTFGYSQNEPILKDFEMSVNKGEIAIIFGESGAGKSTLLSAIIGLIKPQKGQIFLNNIDCTKYSRLSRTAHIHYILQETELFDSTIEENILLGFGDNETGQKQDAQGAAAIAEAEDFIKTLPNGYSTPVGEGGKNLSGGQRQRILIARGLVNNVKLLLLDEPTSALDAITEKALIETIRKIADSGVAIIIVTHRKQLIQYADKLYNF